MPVTPEYEEGYERTFGERKPQRGTFIYDKRLGRCVPIEEYRPEETAEARYAPIMVDRFYEGATTQTMNERNEMVTVDIGTRKRHREYLRENGLATADDFTETWKKAAEQRERVKQGEMPSKTRREVLERRMYEIDKP